jgi:hypothetical protein
VIVIVAGSRSVSNYRAVCAAIEESGYAITCLVSGTARGVDSLGEKWAVEHGVRVVRMPAQWKFHGKAAGSIRNAKMADYIRAHAEEFGGCALIAVWDGESRGTLNMIDDAQSKAIPVFIYRVEL